MDTPQCIQRGKKLFVGGLSPETTQKEMSDYFSQYGKVIDCVVMKDHTAAGLPRSRGFGFVTFAKESSADDVLAVKHRLGGRAIDPKRALPRGSAPAYQFGSVRNKKVFVGGIGTDVDEDSLRQFFSQYGEVSEVVLPVDMQSKRLRGFAFITFETKETADTLCETHFFDMDGKTVEVRHATPKSESQSPSPPPPVRYEMYSPAAGPMMTEYAVVRVPSPMYMGHPMMLPPQFMDFQGMGYNMPAPMNYGMMPYPAYAPQQLFQEMVYPPPMMAA